MVKSKKIISLIIVGIFLVGMIGCNSKKTELTEDEKIKVFNEIKTFEVSEENTLDDLKKLIADNIDSFEVSDRDIMIDIYMTQMYSNATDLSKKLSLVGYELEDMLEANPKVEVNNPKTYKNIPKESSTVKGFLEEVNAKGFALEYSEHNKCYVLRLSSDYIIEEFGEKITPSLKAYLELNAREEKNMLVIDDVKEEVDFDEIVTRLLMIEEGVKLDKEIGYTHIEKWMSTSDYYYSALLGLSHNFNTKDEIVKDEVLDKYKEIIEANKGSQLATILEKTLSILSENNNKLDTNAIDKISKEVSTTIYTDEIKSRLDELSELNEEMQDAINNADLDKDDKEN